jgi:hypothetical protein
MFFGVTSFSAAPFSAEGFSPNAFVNIQGVRLNVTIGDVDVTAPLDLAVTGNRLNISTGNPIFLITL